MKARMWVVLALAALTVAAAPVAEPRIETVADPVADAAEVAAPGDMVPMIELVLPGRTVRGRLVREDEDLIRVQAVGTGVIGYARATVREMRRFSVTKGAFAEMEGDYHHKIAWDADDGPAEFVRARQAYQRALVAADTDGDRARVQAKLELLAGDRREWQQEALRAQELAIGLHEIEIAALETQLTRQKLEMLQRQAQDIEALKAAIQQIQADGQLLTRMVKELEADLIDLEEEVDDLDDLDNFYVRTNVFHDLRRSHERLEREVQRINRSAGH